MARRSQSTIEDAMDITSKLPWWVSMSLAVLSYIVLHWYANQSPPATSGEGVDAIYAAVLPGMFRGFAAFGQVVLPIVFLIGAIVSVFNSYKRKKLHIDTAQSLSTNSLDEISWQDFELLVGEHFRRQGFAVEETAGGADGGIDLIAVKNGEKYLIQCKQWKAYKVGVKVVRELLGVMVGAAASGGFVVTSGQFTHDAVVFAKNNNISLLDGKALRKMIQGKAELPGSVKNSEPASKPYHTNVVMCSKCGAKLILRTAKKGKNVGKQFYGCSSFPKCRYTKEIYPDDVNIRVEH